MRLTYKMLKRIADRHGIKMQRNGSREIEVWVKDCSVSVCYNITEVWQAIHEYISDMPTEKLIGVEK